MSDLNFEVNKFKKEDKKESKEDKTIAIRNKSVEIQKKFNMLIGHKLQDLYLDDNFDLIIQVNENKYKLRGVDRDKAKVEEV